MSAPGAPLGPGRGAAAAGRAPSRGSAVAGAAAIAAKLASAGIGILVNIILARSMGADGYGLYALGFAMAAIITVLASCGMPLSAVRFMPGYLVRGDWAGVRGFTRAALAISAAGGLACALAMVLIATRLVPDSRWAAVLPWAALLLLPGAILQTLATLLQVRGRVAGPEILQSLIRQLVTVGLIVGWILVMGSIGHGTALAAAAAGTTAAALALWVMLRRVSTEDGGAKSARYREFGGWTRAGSGVLVILLIAALNERLDLIVLGWFVTLEDIGVYSGAARLASILILGLAGLHAAYAPRMASAWAAGDRAEVEVKRAEIAALLGDACRASDILYSTRILKKTGLRLKEG